jgi:hypothetical protein
MSRTDTRHQPTERASARYGLRPRGLAHIQQESEASELEVSIGVLEGKAGHGLYRWAHDSLSGRGASPAPAITSDTGGEGELQCVGPQARIHAPPPPAAARSPVGRVCHRRKGITGRARPQPGTQPSAGGHNAGPETRSGRDCATEPGAGVPDPGVEG